MDGGVRSEIKHATLTDDEVVRRVLGGDIALLEIIMRRYNQRLFRVVRSILKDDSQAEDIVQEAYVRAYEHLSQFEGRAKFSTSLSAASRSKNNATNSDYMTLYKSRRRYLWEN